MATPGWLHAELAEEWPADAIVADYGAPRVQDLLDPGATSDESPKAERGTVVVHDGVEGSSLADSRPRAPLAALASASRGMFSQLKLEAMFQPPSDDALRQSQPAPFTFECRATAVRLPTDQAGTRKGAVPDSPLTSRAPRDPYLFATEADTAEPDSAQRDDPSIASGRSRSSPGGSEEAAEPLSPPARSYKRFRQSPPRVAPSSAVLAPRSAVRERVRDRRLARRASAAHATDAIHESTATPAEHFAFWSLPASATHAVDDVPHTLPHQRPLDALNWLRAASPSPKPAPPAAFVATPRALDVVLETEEESDQTCSVASPFRRPMPPTPRQASSRPPWVPGTSANALPLASGEPVDALDQDSAAYAPFGVTVDGREGERFATSPNADLRPALKRGPPPAASDVRDSPRNVSFVASHGAPLPAMAGWHGPRPTSGLRFELGTASNASSPNARESVPSELGPAAEVQELAQIGLAPLLSPSDSDAPQASTSTRASSQSSIFAGRAAARQGASGTRADRTFLTECSFGIARDDLLRHLTAVEPYEPHWAQLRFIDLSDRQLEGVIRLKDLLPDLREIQLSRNRIGFLTGLPAGTKTLGIADNRLSGTASFRDVPHLERLDLCRNQMQSLQQLAILGHLRELKVDGNQLTSLAPLLNLDSLSRLSARHNRIGSLLLGPATWPALEQLDLSGNEIVELRLGRAVSQSLVSLSLDCNRLARFAPDAACPTLRVLRLSSNPLAHLELTRVPALRSLFVDDTHLDRWPVAEGLVKLENVSMRHPRVRRASKGLRSAHAADLRRLYLSGQRLGSLALSRPHHALVYVELAMCQLDGLPPDLASLLPNCRTLVLDHNTLADLAPLRCMERLARLSVAHCRIERCRTLLSILDSLPSLCSLDARGNGCTSALYLPRPVRTTPADAPHAMAGIVEEDKGADCHSSAGDAAWRRADELYRPTLDDHTYLQRTVWRALALQERPTLTLLDGLAVSAADTRAHAALARFHEDRRLTDLYQRLHL